MENYVSEIGSSSVYTKMKVPNLVKALYQPTSKIYLLEVCLLLR